MVATQSSWDILGSCSRTNLYAVVDFTRGLVEVWMVLRPAVSDRSAGFVGIATSACRCTQLKSRNDDWRHLRVTNQRSALKSDIVPLWKSRFWRVWFTQESTRLMTFSIYECFQLFVPEAEVFDVRIYLASPSSQLNRSQPLNNHRLHRIIKHLCAWTEYRMQQHQLRTYL